MRYSCQAEAEMAFDRFVPFEDQKRVSMLPVIEDSWEVDSYIEDDYIPRCNYPRRCHCVECR